MGRMASALYEPRLPRNVTLLPVSAASSDEEFLGIALDEAREAAAAGDVPVGAVVVRDGIVLARDRNRREATEDPTAHAERLVITAAAQRLGTWRLEGCTLYATL